MSLDKNLATEKSRFYKLNILSIYLLIMIAGGWVSYSVFKTGNSIKDVSQSLIDNQLPSLSYISELMHWINEYERVLYEFYATSSNFSDSRPEINPKLNAAEIHIEKNLVNLERGFHNNADIQELAKIFNLMEQHAKLLDKALPPQSHDWDGARNELAIISQYGLDTLYHMNNFKHEIETQIENSKEDSNHQLGRMSVWVSVFAGFILLIAILVGYFIRKSNLHAIEKQRLAVFVENNPNPVACINFEGQLVFKNRSWRRHYPQDSSKELVVKAFNEAKKINQQEFEFTQAKVQDAKQFLELSIHKIESIEQFIVYVKNITEQEVARKELEFLAYHDILTGLPNLKKLEIELSKLISRGNEYPFYLISIGVRRLQLITTTHGHSVSDALMKAVVARLQNCLVCLLSEFEVCRVFRFTGAKFEILLAGRNNLDAYSSAISLLAKQIHAAFQKPLQTTFGQFFLDIQAGYAIFPEHGYSASMLIKNSNAALNEAQKNNLEEINPFDHELAYKEQNWYRLENDMRQSDFEQSFYLMYQPKFDLDDARLVGMEALVRWEHPEKGLIPPTEFIPIAEESGMILALGEWILNTAVRQTSEWVSQGLEHLQVAVNVSPSQLLSVNFVEMVLTSLDAHQLPAKHLEIEITEEVMVDDKVVCISVLEKLKAAGVSIAVDDFGTGYSSLGYLNKFPLSKLKIDRSFVANIHRNEGNYAIVRTIIALSKSLNIEVIAEGIETEEELKVLNQLGCHQGQGYLFAKPLERADFSSSYLETYKDSVNS